MTRKKLSITGTGGTILFIIIGIFIYNILNGLILTFPGLNQTSLLSRFSEIHFSSPGNNFGGGVFWLPIKSLSTPKTITDSKGKTKTCTKQLRGIYYNAARGERLRPLDQETLGLLTGTGGIGYENLNIEGGLYTVCGSSDQYGIFGSIKYNRGGVETYIIGGTKLNYQANTYSSEFANTIEYFNNITPLGYIWDSVGGIGFVGGNITGSESLLDYLSTSGNINSSFNLNGNNINTVSGGWNVDLSGDSQAKDTMRSILIEGNAILSKALDVNEKKALLGNLERKTVLINSDIDASTVINLAKKNSETLCRGKTYFVGGNGNTELPVDNQDNILCYKNTDNLLINLASDLYKNKTIIVKNGNVTLTNTMNKDSAPIDIFVDGGNLYVQSPVINKIDFNQDGYPTSTGATNSGIFIKGTFIINGLLMGKKSDGTISTIENKLHLLGKTVFLNTPTTATQGRISQVNEVLGTGAFENWINLENVFSRYCDLNGVGSDGTSCGASATSATTTPFVVLNSSYESKIIK